MSELKQKEIALPLVFKPQDTYIENAKILGKPLEAHIGYMRENDGSWIISDSSGMRFAIVPFCGKAKRGEAWNAPDPEGMEHAEFIVRAVNNFDALLAACRQVHSVWDSKDIPIRNKAFVALCKAITNAEKESHD